MTGVQTCALPIFPQQLAAGTSLAVMAPIAIVGAWRQSRTGASDWSTGLRFGLAAIPGSLLGAAVAIASSGNVVRTLFSLVLVAVALQMLRTGWSSKKAK